jgi:hypothetical protein
MMVELPPLGSSVVFLTTDYTDCTDFIASIVMEFSGWVRGN